MNRLQLSGRKRRARTLAVFMCVYSTLALDAALKVGDNATEQHTAYLGLGVVTVLLYWAAYAKGIKVKW